MLFLLYIASNIICKSKQPDTGKLFSVYKKMYLTSEPDDKLITYTDNVNKATEFELERFNKIYYILKELKQNSKRVLDYRYSEGRDLCLYNRHGGKNQQFQFLYTPEGKLSLSVYGDVCLQSNDKNVGFGQCEKNKSEEYEFCWEPLDKQGLCSQDEEVDKNNLFINNDNQKNSSLYKNGSGRVNDSFINNEHHYINKQ